MVNRLQRFSPNTKPEISFTVMGILQKQEADKIETLPGQPDGATFKKYPGLSQLIQLQEEHFSTILHSREIVLALAEWRLVTPIYRRKHTDEDLFWPLALLSDEVHGALRCTTPDSSLSQNDDLPLFASLTSATFCANSYLM
ncbi:hypothetical protein POM88_043256 [Heracleum sosnowskyi]|uniref:Uncharacterized protein n=1 Tax=Heracleum sosnowskyi TaxID=360622 RepID=A0AAD8H382_9APIA|nr:hypothetical protein POM88_043256 [Heracleum sosnowskyi]